MSIHGTNPLRRGFTLIEVLVVVAIIALLIAILLPSLARVRYQAKNIACRANMHDLGQAFNMYADQYKGFYPAGPFQIRDSFQQLYDARLMKNPQILVCPGTENVVRPGSVRRAQTAADYVLSQYSEEAAKNLRIAWMDSSDICEQAGSAQDGAGGHSYEYLSCWYSRNGGSAVRCKINFVFPPVDRLLVHDSDEAQPQGNKGCVSSNDGSGNNCPQPWDNHGAEGMNMMFADGHAQFTRKMGGTYRDWSTRPPGTRFNENASIDFIWQKANHPYLFTGRN
jgi:prepilin-type N-terminal cleavage/methylation domain-containing protein/prepilin-type processing-associated H-X9-DG protein